MIEQAEIPFHSVDNLKFYSKGVFYWTAGSHDLFHLFSTLLYNTECEIQLYQKMMQLLCCSFQLLFAVQFILIGTCSKQLGLIPVSGERLLSSIRAN